VTSLFISNAKPHKAVTKSTISRWIKTVLTMAGLDMTIFNPHSTQAASTSHANGACISVDTIMQTAGWRQESTFCKFYKTSVRKTGEFGLSLFTSSGS
jgi:hypothetical protein